MSMKIWGECHVPPRACDGWSVSHFSVSKDRADFTRLRAMINRDYDEHVPAGNYMKLCREDTTVMSNTPMEYRSNAGFIRKATGDVFIAGLGLGLVVRCLLDKPDVASITVCELSHEVIKLVGPSVEHERLKIVHADVHTFKFTRQFDSLWFDIWDERTADNLPQMARLHRRCARFWTRKGPRGSWFQKELQRMERAERVR